jgi:predicted nucleic acid-binding protein
VRIFVDTSILIPLFYGDHPHHQAGIQSIDRLESETGFCSAHGLVETYSSLTRMPGKYRATPERARMFIASLRERLQIVALSEAEY